MVGSQSTFNTLATLLPNCPVPVSAVWGDVANQLVITFCSEVVVVGAAIPNWDITVDLRDRVEVVLAQEGVKSVRLHTFPGDVSVLGDRFSLLDATGQIENNQGETIDPIIDFPITMA